MASLTQKLFTIGQNIGGGQERVQLSRQGSYRPVHLGSGLSEESSSGQSNPFGAMGILPSAEDLGFGQLPKSGILSKLFGG